MKVYLKQNWFGPDGRLYRRVESGTTAIPDKFKDKLPKSAKVDEQEVKVEVEPKDTSGDEGGDKDKGADKGKAGDTSKSGADKQTKLDL